MLHFLETGILIASGHELNIHESWVAQCYWTESCPQRQDPSTDSVGIHLAGDDHTLMGVTVFDWVSVGIRIEQPTAGTGGNLLQGVHLWNGGTNGRVQGPGIAVSLCATSLCPGLLHRVKSMLSCVRRLTSPQHGAPTALSPATSTSTISSHAIPTPSQSRTRSSSPLRLS